MSSKCFNLNSKIFAIALLYAGCLSITDDNLFELIRKHFSWDNVRIPQRILILQTSVAKNRIFCFVGGGGLHFQFRTTLLVCYSHIFEHPYQYFLFPVLRKCRESFPSQDFASHSVRLRTQGHRREFIKKLFRYAVSDLYSVLIVIWKECSWSHVIHWVEIEMPGVFLFIFQTASLSWVHICVPREIV